MACLAKKIQTEPRLKRQGQSQKVPCMKPKAFAGSKICKKLLMVLFFFSAFRLFKNVFYSYVNVDKDVLYGFIYVAIDSSLRANSISF